MNWRVQYPITVQEEDLRTAFLSATGVYDFVTRLINAVLVSIEYDEFLLFKYLMIKAISKDKMYSISFNSSDMSESAVQFRATSNNMTFISTRYNQSGVHTNTSKTDQQIFMDSEFNARYDVNVLASAFNMDKANFMGSLNLIDNWDTFDNDRFEVIRAESDGLEPVTQEELELMHNVRAVLIDPEWFQVYDNLSRMTEANVASGLYQNYFYNVWMTISSSPFSNAVVFVDSAESIVLPNTIKFVVDSKSTSDDATVFTLAVDDENNSTFNLGYNFTQIRTAVENGIAIHRMGGVIYPAGKTTALTLEFTLPAYNVTYRATTTITPATQEGVTINFNKVDG